MEVLGGIEGVVGVVGVGGVEGVEGVWGRGRTQAVSASPLKTPWQAWRIQDLTAFYDPEPASNQ